MPAPGVTVASFVMGITLKGLVAATAAGPFRVRGQNSTANKLADASNGMARTNKTSRPDAT